jgi:hypothetical protein
MANALQKNLGRVGLSLGALLGSACATAPQARVQPVLPQCSSHCTPAPAARRDVMTWRDYYSSVMTEGSRRNALVVWVNPPKAVRPGDQRLLAAHAAAFHSGQGGLR